MAWLPAKRRKRTATEVRQQMAIVDKEILESAFWKGADLKAEQPGTIANEFENDSSGKYGTRLTGKLTIGKETKKISLNNTSAKKLVDAYGKDTAKWEGKKTKVEVITQLVSGEKKKIIYVYPK
jgi:hypothetical protein